ncbi:tetratricopeptide repeat protein [Actinomycetospora termitidis]|uniref:Tetratricopeptide repeat protein n=1 Tax=Actinomycetospora termitidis TaxID=3053470 RepID=A0ABT7M8Q2_9PSEU|nr:tetratricopeptide repeat protein [Actinomycetospora sp. Odt1-22]MDL5157036.1 tetratricopeptide repeat protein [Actinomycetospora sp. Odt1-22]
MARPDPRQAAQAAALSSAMAGAVDLSGLKARAEQRNAPQRPASGGGGGAAPSSGGSVAVEVTEANLQEEILDRSMTLPVVVELTASGDPAVAELSATLEKLAVEGRGGWVLARVDLRTNQRIAQMFQVQEIPTVHVVVAQRPVQSFSGIYPEDQLRPFFTQLLEQLGEQMPGIAEAQARFGGDESAEPAPEPEDPRFTAAEEALERGDYDAAVAAYEQILAAEPANAEAQAALSQVRFMSRAESADPSAIAAADAAPDDVAAQKAAADAELAGGQVEAAFDRLVKTVQRTAGEDRDAAREHLVSLFELFAADDPRVTTARRALARALY